MCAVRVIAESDAVQEFLTDSDDSSNPSPVDLKVLLPDREVVTVAVLKSTNADDVFRAVCDKIGLSKQVQKYFYLFEIVEYNFGELAKVFFWRLVICEILFNIFLLKLSCCKKTIHS